MTGHRPLPPGRSPNPGTESRCDAPGESSSRAERRPAQIAPGRRGRRRAAGRQKHAGLGHRLTLAIPNQPRQLAKRLQPDRRNRSAIAVERHPIGDKRRESLAPDRHAIGRSTQKVRRRLKRAFRSGARRIGIESRRLPWAWRGAGREPYPTPGGLVPDARTQTSTRNIMQRLTRSRFERFRPAGPGRPSLSTDNRSLPCCSGNGSVCARCPAHDT